MWIKYKGICDTSALEIVHLIWMSRVLHITRIFAAAREIPTHFYRHETNEFFYRRLSSVYRFTEIVLRHSVHSITNTNRIHSLIEFLSKHVN